MSIEIIREHTVAFTGHRNLSGSNEMSLFSSPRSLRERLLDAICAAIGEGYTTFLCGMAEGFDLLAGECVLELRAAHPHIVLIAAIPFGKQSERFSPDGQALYDRVLEGCDQAVILQQAYGPLCYFARNDYLVDHSSRMIAYYDGSKGGTAYTVKRALKQGLIIVNVYQQ